jgi:hypothetical protein
LNEELKKQWEEYLEQTQKHVEIVRELCEQMGLDPKSETPGRQVVRHIGKSLVKAMEMALDSGKPEAAHVGRGSAPAAIVPGSLIAAILAYRLGKSAPLPGSQQRRSRTARAEPETQAAAPGALKRLEENKQEAQ